MTLKTSHKRILQVGMIILGLIALVVGVRRLSLGVGHLDFQGYWSATYLLSQSEDFTDDASLLALERSIANPNQKWVIKTWNPPWLLAWLLPLTLISFDQAVALWLFFNVILLAGSALLVTGFHATQGSQARLALPLLATLLFPSSIVAIMFGQVNLLVLAGLAGCLLLLSQGRDVQAGAALALTLAKPHLVYLTLPLLLLTAMRQRRWGVIAGLAAVLVLSLGVVFLLRPSFLGEYVASLGQGQLLNWQAASLPTYLQFTLGWPWIRYAFVLMLPLAIALWAWRGRRWSLAAMVDVSVLASVITMPFGWSYDFVVLLLPLLRLLVWLVEGALGRVESAMLGLILGTAYFLMFRQRIASPGEMAYFWIPILVAVLYGWVAYRVWRRPADGKPASAAEGVGRD